MPTTAYEAIFIVDTTQPDEQTKATVEKYTGLIEKQGGTVDDVDQWEPRRLAYEVKGRREGRYVVVNFTGEPAVKDELDRIFRISDDVLRHLIVKQDPKADRFPSKLRAAENERREREAAARVAASPTPVAQPITDLSEPEAPVAEPEAEPVTEAEVEAPAAVETTETDAAE